MKRVSELLQEINARRNDIRSLLPYLNTIAESDLPVNESRMFEELLNDKNEFIRLFAFKVLFVNMKLDVENYKEKIISKINSKSEDFDLRIECSSAIANRYKGTKDKLILKLFYDLFNDKNENDLLRESFFECLLRVYGMAERDIILRNKKFSIKFTDVSLDAFKNELKEIQNLI